MAVHRKKKKNKPTRRRRRIGALALNPSSSIVQIASLAGGFFLADKINPMIDKVADPTKVDQKLVAAGQVGLGAAYLYLKKGKKNIILTVASGLVAGAGVKRAMTAFGIGDIAINGYQRVPSVNGVQRMPSINGYQRVPAVGNYNPGPGGMGMNATKQVVSSNGLLVNRMRA